MVALLLLVMHGEYGHRPRIVDPDPRPVAGAAERNDQFAQKRAACPADDLAPGERKVSSASIALAIAASARSAADIS
ncbi:MAG: hypothetical protein WCF44_22005 [Candidatus Methylophosphatis roskildensis]